MTVRSEPLIESRNTLVLYCPYDRKVTRHTRRGDEREVACVECGRHQAISQDDHAGRWQSSSQPALSWKDNAREDSESIRSNLRSIRARRAHDRATRLRRHASWWVPIALGAGGALLAVGVLARVVSGPGQQAPATVASSAPVEVPLSTNESLRPVLAPAAALPPVASEPAVSPTSVPATPTFAPSAIQITNTDGQGAYIRRSPNLNDRLRPWAEGTQLRVIGPDTAVDGTTWKQVEDPAGNRGWIPAQFTRG